MTREILDQAQTIAVVGLSTNPFKTAHRIPAAMQALGYTVIGVHPSADELLGRPAYRTLAEVPVPVDIVNVFRPSPEAAGIAREAVAIGAGALWLQKGIVSPEAARIADEAGMAYVEDRCIAVDAHRWGVRRSA
ncbi:MAG TPA: CoA-binding protein [Egibacteraceae bacterium]|nr:CoA-binding protein [Egibacteraceae bacterium]